MGPLTKLKLFSFSLKKSYIKHVSIMIHKIVKHHQNEYIFWETSNMNSMPAYLPKKSLIKSTHFLGLPWWLRW